MLLSAEQIAYEIQGAARTTAGSSARTTRGRVATSDDQATLRAT